MEKHGEHRALVKGLIGWCEDRINRQTALVFALVLLPLTVVLDAASVWVDPALRWRLPIGHDFPAFWTAAHLYWQGGLAAVYDLKQFEAVQMAVSVKPGLLLWHYPPTWLLLVLPLGWLSYPVAFFAFTLGGIAALAAVARRILPEVSLLGRAALFGAPVVAVVVNQGQNGLYVTAAFVGAFWARELGRGWLAAVLIASLLVKPQFGVLIPVALLAVRDWRLIGQTALACAGFVLVVTLALGPEAWSWFAQNARALPLAMRSGDLWTQQPTAYAALMLVGAPERLALTGQVVSALVAAWVVWVAWSGKGADRDRQLAVLLFATLMVSPYAFRYDMGLALAGTLLLVRPALTDGFMPGEKLGLTLLWLMPGIFPVIAAASGVQLGLTVSLGGLACCRRRA